MATAIGRIESIEGYVEVSHANGFCGALVQGAIIYANDVITTVGNSNLEIRFLDGSGMNIDPETTVTLNKDSVNPDLIPENEVSSQVVLDASDRLITLDNGQGTAGTVEKTGTVETIKGVVVALEDNGTIRVLKSGDPLYASDVIQVDSNGDASIRMIDGSLLSFDPGTTTRLEDSAPSLPAYFAESGLTDPVQIQAAIQEGRDPSQEATAPTAGVPGSNEGGIPVILSSSTRAVTPSSGHDTHGFELPFRILEQDLLEGLAPDLAGEEGELTASISAIKGGTAVEGTPVTFEVSLDKLSDEATTVVVNVFSGPGDNATQGADYAATAQYTVVIAAGSISNTFTVDTIDDAMFESDETFSAQIDTVTNPSGPVMADPGIATGTITDNDMPMVSLSAIKGGTAVEGTPVTFEVSMDMVSDEDTTVVVDVFTGPNDDAIQGTDYAATTQYTVVIAAGTDSNSFTVDTLDDEIFEGDETFSAQIFSVDNPNGMVLVEPGTATIIDNDTPTISLSALAGGTAEEGTPVTFEVSMDTVSNEDTTVVVNVFSGPGDDAIQGTDYAATAQYTVVIAAGSTSNTFTVDTLEDALFEGAETFSAQIDTATNPNGPVLTDTGIATGTITDNDTDTPTISLSALDGGTAEEGLPVSFEVSMDTVSDEDTTVVVNVFSGPGDDAIQGTDYAATTSYTVVIAAGSLSNTFTVDTLEDALFEGAETFSAQIDTATNPNGPVLTDTGIATGTITDNDTDTPTISLSALDGGTAEEGLPVSFEVSMDTLSDEDTTVVVNVFSGPGDDAIQGTDYAATTSYTVVIAAGSLSNTFTVDTLEDALFEGAETFSAQIDTATNPNGPVLTDTGIATGTITDNDSDTPTISLSALDGGTAEEGLPVSFEVSMDTLSDEDTTVVVNVFSGPGDDAIQGTDYAATTSYTVVIAAGSLSNTFTVDTLDDALFEGAETFSAQIDTATNPNGPVLTDTGIATGTITDNDSDTPTISLSALDGGTAEEGLPVTFEVSMDTLSDEDTTVVVNVFSGPNDDAIQGTDYAATTSYTVVIAAGSLSNTFTVDTLEDALFEGAETFSAQIDTATNPNGPVLTDTGIATGTITDNDTDTPTISLSALDGGTAEEGLPVSFEVSMDTVSDEDTTVVVNVFSGPNDDAIQGTDYAATTSYTVVIAAGSLSNTFTVDTLEDALFEGAETFSAQIDTATNPNGPVLTDPGIATGTITDNDTDTPTISLSALDGGTAEEGLPVSFEVSMDTLSDEDTTVVVNVFSGPNDDAIQGTDYAATTSYTVVIAAGSLSNTFTVDTLEDALFEGAETFSAQIDTATNPNGPVLTDTGIATGTITDNDTDTPTISLSALDGGTAEEGLPVSFEVSMDTVSDEDTTVVVNVFSGPGDDAIQGTDYAATTSYTVVIAAGSLSNTFTVDTLEDAIFEGAETFSAQIDTATNPNGPVITDAGIATGTITDNDTDTPTISLSALDGGTAEEGLPVSFEVSMDTLSDEDTTVVVNVFSGPGDDAIQGTDYAATTSYTVVIAAGSLSNTFTVDTLEDAIFEGAETFSAQIDTATNPNGPVITDTGIATGTITDNDSDTPTISLSALDGGTAEEGLPVSFEVSMDTLSDEDTTVVVNVFSGPNDDAIQGTDYAATTSYTVVIAAGSLSNTFTVDTLEDALFEGAETFSAQIDTATNPNGPVLTDTGIATGTITDNDSDTPTISLSALDGGTAEEGLPVSFEVSLDTLSDEDTTVVVNVFSGPNDDAIQGTDYAATTSYTVVIAAGSLSNTFTVDTLEDALFEGAETFSAQIDTATNPNGPVIADPGIATGTITDNENAFIVGTNFDDAGPDNTNPHAVNNTPLDSGAIIGGANADILVGDTGGTKTTDATGKNSNIILILDKSGSMKTEISFTDSNGNTDTMSRLNALKLSVDALLTELEGSTANEVRVHIIQFDKKAQSVGTFDLKQPGGLGDAIAAVNGITVQNGSTNYEDGLQKAIDWSGIPGNLLDDEGGTREVVNQTFFISDGKPRAFNTADDTTGNRTTKDDDLALGHATGVEDNVSEVATLIGQFGKIEAVGIALANEVEIDNLNEVEGAPRGSNPDVADNIFTANDLIDVLQVLNPLTGLSELGDDTITGGDGDDFIFGDSLFTDTLAADQGLIADHGSGWQVFADLEEDTARDWDRDDTINYIQANHVEVAAELLLDGAGRKGGNDSIDAGAGNDTVYGQEGDDMIIGGAGDDLLSGGTGADTFIWQSDETGTDTITDFDPDADGDVLDIADLLTGADGLQADELDGAYISISIAADATVSIYSDGDGAVAGTPDQVIELTGYNTTGFTNSADVIDSLLGSDNLVTD